MTNETENEIKNSEYTKYMNFCDEYKNKIENAKDTLLNFLDDIPKDATLYVANNVIEDTIRNLKEIDEWIKGTLELSEEDFNYE